MTRYLPQLTLAALLSFGAGADMLTTHRGGRPCACPRAVQNEGIPVYAGQSNRSGLISHIMKYANCPFTVIFL